MGADPRTGSRGFFTHAGGCACGCAAGSGLAAADGNLSSAVAFEAWGELCTDLPQSAACVGVRRDCMHSPRACGFG